MKKRQYRRFYDWEVEYAPEDGARIRRLSYKGFDLLTSEKEPFCPPKKDFGEYENRPVYGYDDCFPSLTRCKYPESGLTVPDRGELYRLEWDSKEEENRLVFKVRSKLVPVTFIRSLSFEKDRLSWEYEVVNDSDGDVPFLHVPHPLMPLERVKNLRLPGFSEAVETHSNISDIPDTPEDIESLLLESESGTAMMLFLREITEGIVEIDFKDGPSLILEFANEFFPTLGLWWNNGGYPPEEGIKRSECAFEPVSASNASLEEAFLSGSYLEVLANESFSWNFIWKIEE